jgi:glycosyltransferase involved in cell wall biosynthesis
MLLVPSLCEDCYPRVAVEAIMNRIPLLASPRGGLPEILASAGGLIDIPRGFASNSLEVPTSKEAKPWMEAIEELWDHESAFRNEQLQCAKSSDEWLPKTVERKYASFFESLLTVG